MSLYSHNSKACHIGEFNVSENVDDLLACHLQHSSLGEHLTTPALFWMNGWLFCCCAYSFGFTRQEGNQADREKSRDMCLVWSLPLVCCVEMRNYQPTLELAAQKGLNFVVTKPQSAFLRGVLQQLIEATKEASE